MDVYKCDTIITMNEMQRFMLTRCTDDISYWNIMSMMNGCLQSKRQYGDKVLSSSAGVHEGIEIVMNECLDNGVSQKFYFNECHIQYAHALLMYLQENDQSLCIGLVMDSAVFTIVQHNG
eukprot:253366_1